MNSVFFPKLYTSTAWVWFAQADSAAADNSAVAVQSVWDFVLKGGPMMIPIGLCSFVAITVFIERLVSLRKRNIVPAEFLPEVSKRLEQGTSGKDDALSYCRENVSPIANIFAAGIKRLGDSVEVVERAVRDAGAREIVKLRRYSRVLSVIAAIAPLLGLLGTIFGMIEAFQTVATSGEALGRTELLAKGIYEAMITTAGGLLVAIPTLMMFHYLSAKVEALVADMDHKACDFVEEHARPVVVQSAEAPRLRAVESDSADGAPERVTTATGRA